MAFKAKKPTFVQVSLVMFMRILHSVSFRNQVNLQEQKIPELLKWIHDHEDEDAEELRSAMNSKFETRKEPNKLRSCFKEGPASLREIGTEQSKQIFRVAVAFHMYGLREPRVLEYAHFVIESNIVPCSLLVGTSFVTAKCNRRNLDKDSNFGTRVPISFEVLVYLHALSYCTKHFRSSGRRMKSTFKTNYTCSNRVGYAVQLVTRAWSELARRIGATDCKKLVSPYIIFKKEKGGFEVLSRKEEGFSPSEQAETLLGDSTAARDAKDVDSEVWARSKEQDAAFRHVTDMFFKHLHKLVSHEYLFSCENQSDWRELDVYRFEKGKHLPKVFESLSRETRRNLGLKEEEVVVIDDDDVGTESVGKQSEPATAMADVTTASPSSGKPDSEEDEIQPVLPKKARSKRRRSSERGGGGGGGGGGGIVEVVKFERELVGAGEQEVKRRRRTGSASETRGQKDFEVLKERLVQAMLPYCRVHAVPAAELVDTDADETACYLDGKVQLIVTDPPYNTRSERKAPNSSHDRLTLEDMKSSVELFDRLLKPGGHGIVFCSALQFNQWHSLLQEYKAKEEDAEDDDAEDEDKEDSTEEVGSQPFVRTEHQRMFNVEDVPLYFVRAPGHYFQNPAQKNLCHRSVVEQAIHFWKKGLDGATALKTVNYTNQGYVATRHQAFTNCMDNIPRLSDNEVVKIPPNELNGGKRVRPEQKNVDVMMEVVGQYTDKGDIVVDPMCGTCSGGKATMGLREHRIFVGSDSDSRCVEHSLPALVETFARQLLNPDSDITGSEEVIGMAKEFLEHPKLAVARASNFASPWEPPRGLPMYQRLPIHVHRLLASMSGEKEIAEDFKNCAPDQWPLHFRALLNTIDPVVLLGVEAAAKGFAVCKSEIRHPSAGRGVFAMRPFNAGEDILTYYGTLVYSPLSKEDATTKEYGNGILGVRKQRFHETALNLRSEVQDDDGKSRPIYIVPAPFCLAAYINDPRYNEGDMDLKGGKPLHKREANVYFEESTASPDKRSLRSNKLTVLRTKRRIRVGEELYIDYGRKFVEWGSSPARDSTNI